MKTGTAEPHEHQVYCPISGRFSFSYDIDDGTESAVECANSDSQISNCPLGFGLHLNFKGCAFRPNFSECFEFLFVCQSPVFAGSVAGTGTAP